MKLQYRISIAGKFKRLQNTYIKKMETIINGYIEQ
jgi:hypothetical protein